MPTGLPGYGADVVAVVVGIGSVEVVMPPPEPLPQPAKIIDAITTTAARRMVGA